MNGPRYIQRNVYMLKNKEREYEQHVRKLGMIEARKPERVVEEEEPLNEKLLKRKQNLMRFQASEKYFNINRDNQVLLEKLVEISQGKWASVTTQKDMQVTQAVEAKQPPKTLNSRFKKREAQRIAQENEAMAHRLVDSHPIISRKRLEKDYKKILEAKKVMVRMTSSPQMTSTKTSMKLPPLKTGTNFKPAKKTKSKSMHKTIDAMDVKDHEEVEHDHQDLNDREPAGELGSPVEVPSPTKPRKEEKPADNEHPQHEEPPKKKSVDLTLNLNAVAAEPGNHQPGDINEPSKEQHYSPPKQTPPKQPEPVAGNQHEKSIDKGNARASGRHETAGPNQSKQEDFNPKAAIMKSITLAPKKNLNEPLQKSPTALQDKSLIQQEPAKSDEKISQGDEKQQQQENLNPEEKKEEEVKPEVKAEEKPEANPEIKPEEQPAA